MKYIQIQKVLSKMKNLTTTHTTDQGLEIEYTYWHDRGDYFQPEEYGIEIQKIMFEGVDVTDLLYYVADNYLDELVDELEIKHKNYE